MKTIIFATTLLLTSTMAIAEWDANEQYEAIRQQQQIQLQQQQLQLQREANEEQEDANDDKRREAAKSMGSDANTATLNRISHFITVT